MKKKALSLLLVGAMAMGLAACGSSTASGSSAGTESTDEVVNLRMQIVTFGQEFDDLDAVEDAINAISEEQIGVTVTLDPVACWDLPSTSSLAISSNEEIDLMAIIPMGSNMDSILNYTSSNMLRELNDLYAEYGQDIKSCIGELEAVGYVGDTLYAIPANYYAGSATSAYLARTDLLEDLGMMDQFADESQTHTIDELDELFAAYQAKYGAEGGYAITGFADQDLVEALVNTDDLGDNAVGSLMNGGLDDTTVVNRYATEEYYEAYQKIREWNLAGYINPDATQITDTFTSLLSTGFYLGSFCGVNGTGLEGVPHNAASAGYDLTVIRLQDQDIATTTVASYGLWAIPVTCAYPEKAMQFLNLMYTDAGVDDILSAGLEGEYYQVVETLDDGRELITYADGVDATSAHYTGQLPIYGNALTTPKMSPVDAEIFDEIVDYNNTLVYSKAFGYSFDSSAYSAQTAAIKSAIEQYSSQLNFGTVDVDEVLPQFLSALEDAGINDVIAGNQEQLDAWLALQ